MANSIQEKRGKLRVLELFSGIGGWHCGLEDSEVPHDVVAAADVNTAANEIYKLNFPNTRVINKAIQAVSVEDFERFDVDMIVMSPPCQPFTRVGLQRDTEDVRTKPFLHILKVLESLKNLPKYLLLENVKGFEVSHARDLLTKTMDKCGYNYQEFLLTPLQFGVPNARLRYYFLAKRKPLTFDFPTKTTVWEDLPKCAKNFLSRRIDCVDGKSLSHEIAVKDSEEHTENNDWMGWCDKCREMSQNEKVLPSACENVAPVKKLKLTCGPCDENNGTPGACDKAILTPVVCDEVSSGECVDLMVKDSDEVKTVPEETANSIGSDGEELLAHEIVEKDLWKYMRHCRTLQNYLEHEDEAYFDDYLVPEGKLKHMAVMDIVKEADRKCICFTKSYGHHMNGTGSMLQQGPDPDRGVQLKKKDFSESEWESVKQLKLRFFTPREIAQIMCFPPKYKFPQHFTKRQCYRVLGNSLNVHVCSTLIKLLVMPEMTT